MTYEPLSVVVPAKNEAGSIGRVVAGVRAVVPQAEVVVVDDGSADGTGAEAAAAGARVVRHPVSRGNGAAIKTGAREARGELLVFMDADGQHDPQDIPRLLARFADGFDLVVGARGPGSQASFARAFGNRFYNWLATRIVGHPVLDLTSGFRAARARRFREFLSLLPNGFSYPTTSTMCFYRAGYGVDFVPITAGRREGKGHIRLLVDGGRFLLIIFRVGTLYSPLKIFFPASLALMLAGTGYSVWTLVLFHRFTNGGALLLVTALLVFFMGLISEQITMLLFKDTRAPAPQSDVRT